MVFLGSDDGVSRDKHPDGAREGSIGGGEGDGVFTGASIGDGKYRGLSGGNLKHVRRAYLGIVNGDLGRDRIGVMSGDHVSAQTAKLIPMIFL